MRTTKKIVPQDIRIECWPEDIAAARKALDLTPGEVDSILNLPYGTIQGLESGEKIPTLPMLRRIAASYGLKVIPRQPTHG